MGHVPGRRWRRRLRHGLVHRRRRHEQHEQQIVPLRHIITPLLSTATESLLTPPPFCPNLPQPSSAFLLHNHSDKHVPTPHTMSTAGPQENCLMCTEPENEGLLRWFYYFYV